MVRKNKYKNKNRKFVIIALGLFALLAATNIQTTQNLTASTQQHVLGDEGKSEEKKEEKREDNKGSENKQEEGKQEESEKKQQEQQKETVKQNISNTSNTSNSSGRSSTGSQKTKTETVSPSGLKMKTESEGVKQETEIETADGQKIKTKIEADGTTKIEIENGTVKLKYRVENGQVVLKVENEIGEEVELEDDELKKLGDAVEEELGDDDVKLAPTTNNQLAVTKNQVTAVTNFPLAINVVTKQLIITTPEGQRVVTILPDEAVGNLLATGIINKVETPPADTTTQGQLGALTGVVKLEIRNNEIVYKVNGTKTHRMLGFIPVTTPVTAFVSADTGNTVAKQQSVLTNIVDLLSP